MAEEYQGVENRHIPRNPVTELSYQKFGYPTQSRTSAITVQTAPTQAVKANPNRVAMLIFNNSAGNVHLSFEPDVSSTKGVTIPANGGAFKMSFDDYGEAITEGLHMSCASGPLTLTLIEVVAGGY